jgi:hypothetical protein
MNPMLHQRFQVHKEQQLSILHDAFPFARYLPCEEKQRQSVSEMSKRQSDHCNQRFPRFD